MAQKQTRRPWIPTVCQAGGAREMRRLERSRPQTLGWACYINDRGCSTVDETRKAFTDAEIISLDTGSPPFDSQNQC